MNLIKMSSKVIIELNPLSQSKPLKYQHNLCNNKRKNIKLCRHQLNEKYCDSCKEYQKYINLKLKYYGEDNRNYGKRQRSSNEKNIPYKKRKY